MSWGMLLGGIGLFLFGMVHFEHAIKQLGGKTIKRLLQEYTNRVRKGVGMGIGMTALAQSSTIVSLMVVGFVGAGLLSLHNAMSVVVGANLGSTFTSWMIALLGFKTNIFSIAFYFVGIGGFGQLLTNERSKWQAVRRLLFGFGLLFLGINFLQESVHVITTRLDVTWFEGIGLFAAIGVGLIMAFITQTSAATSAILLSALHTGLIEFELAAAVMIGANLGSAFTTSIIGSLSSGGKSRVKKQLMIGHTLFNIITATIVTIFFHPLLALINLIIPSGDPIVSLTVFHTAFNLTGVILLSPLVGLYTRRISRVFPADKKGLQLHVEQVVTPMPEEVLAALEKDVDHLRKAVYEFIRGCFGTRVEHVDETSEVCSPENGSWLKCTWAKLIDHTKQLISKRIMMEHYEPDPLEERLKDYAIVKEMEATMYNFIVRLPKDEFVNGYMAQLSLIQERMFALLDAAKMVKDDMNHIERISGMDEEHVVAYRTHVCEKMEETTDLQHLLHTHEKLFEQPDEDLKYFLKEKSLYDNKTEDDLSKEEITELLKTSRHAMHVITLLRQEVSLAYG